MWKIILYPDDNHGNFPENVIAKLNNFISITFYFIKNASHSFTFEDHVPV